jgi:hypothetical protein
MEGVELRLTKLREVGRRLEIEVNRPTPLRQLER